MGAGVHGLEQFSNVFPGQKQGAKLEVEQPGPNGAAGIRGSRLLASYIMHQHQKVLIFLAPEHSGTGNFMFLFNFMNFIQHVWKQLPEQRVHHVQCLSPGLEAALYHWSEMN